MSGELAVLVSGTGSNLRALAEAIDAGHCAGRVRVVIADRPCPAIEWARARGIETEVVRPKAYADRATWDVALAEVVAAHSPEWVVLAGFMRIVGAGMLARFGGRIVNVHPSLLPLYPGLDAPGQAVAAGAAQAGCTVHLVDAGVDTGPMLAQAACAVRDDDSGPTLHGRIQPLEHRLLPAVVDSLVRNA
ncbi:MAG: phosphoribosylglycinamide formyltransferase [Sandaracinaceae bacterium]